MPPKKAKVVAAPALVVPVSRQVVISCFCASLHALLLLWGSAEGLARGHLLRARSRSFAVSALARCLPPARSPTTRALRHTQRDLAKDLPLDGCEGALGIGNVEIGARVRELKAGLVDWSLSEVSRAGTMHLELPESGLDSIPMGLSLLPWLQALNLSNNMLTNGCVAHIVAALPHLRALDLSGNLLAGVLPPALGSLGDGLLEELFLDSNLISSFPPEGAALTALTWLSLKKNQLTALPGPMLAASGATLLHINATDNLLTALPAEIGACVALEELIVTGNALAELPQTLGQAVSLIELHAAGNKLTVFPACLASCTALEVLDLSTNLLTGPLPGEPFLPLVNLLILHLACNKLTQLPDELGQLGALEVLNVSSTTIKALPESCSSLTNLRELNCTNTGLTALPAGAAAWTAIEAAMLRGCKLKTLPVGVEETWSACRILDVKGAKGKDTCKVPEIVRDKLRGSHIVGALWQKAKPKKAGKK
jgi:Leucine-rich repeat (LRR) protein